MKVGIMQPYFLPYIGYFQLIAAVDLFVVYDNIKYTKKGWINRNRLLQGGADAVFSLPLKKDSDALDVVERELAADFNRQKLLNQFIGAYRSAPYFEPCIELLHSLVMNEETNLFRYIHGSIVQTCSYLGITTPIAISSGVPADHAQKGEDRVLAICEACHADTYINTIGGLELYSRERFSQEGIALQFIRSLPIEYKQFGKDPFVPWLSMVDVMMFNPADEIRDSLLPKFELV
ncbi:WbqC-like protein family protein [Variovorax boronicumulans]|uniref:WbqC family protein n=1 Tax=Variovorax boronicumulans TaxID=436515 RepID=UPI000BB35D52|nr:WbqC family protein [Variovorax boronicumulans]PBI87005.1 WbqC-like protein family protein [Variovorax boronicumulans]